MNSGEKELKKKIYEDIQSEIHKYYDSEGIKYKNKENPETTIMNFRAYYYCLIPVKKYNVFYSKELLSKINSKDLPEKHINILKDYENAFLNGKDMNFFLSNNTKKIEKPDFLRYTWHLYHLHMSGKFVENKEQMKNNRSDTQLLCIIASDGVYFIDVIPHPTKAEGYFNIRSLEIIQNNNWMDKIGFYEETEVVLGSIKPKITTDKDIFKIYSKCSANIAFEFNGKVYFPINPINSRRKPCTLLLEKINNIF